MTTKPPPAYYFSGITFNSSYYTNVDESDYLTQPEGDLRYLIKTQSDSTNYLQAFSGGLDFSGEINGPTITASGAISANVIKTNNYQSSSVNQALSLGNNQTAIDATLSIAVNSERLGPINIGTGTTTGAGHTVNIGSGSLTPINLNGATTITAELSVPTVTANTQMKSNLYRSTSVNQALSLGDNQTGPNAKMNIACNVGRNGDINIANTQTTGSANIVIGSDLLTTGSQNIQINRPLTIGYSAIDDLQYTTSKIGSYLTNASSETLIVNSATSGTTLTNFSNIPPGIYLFNYQINYRVTVNNTVFSRQLFILSTTFNDFEADNIIAGDFSSLFKTNQEVAQISSPTTAYTHNNSKCGTLILNETTDIYLNYRIVHNQTTTVPYIIGSLRLVRIG
jgi:hypothetical protein